MLLIVHLPCSPNIQLLTAVILPGPELVLSLECIDLPHSLLNTTGVQFCSPSFTYCTPWSVLKLPGLCIPSKGSPSSENSSRSADAVELQTGTAGLRPASQDGVHQLWLSVSLEAAFPQLPLGPVLLLLVIRHFC